MDRSHSSKASIGALPADYTPDRPDGRDGESVGGLVAQAIVFLPWWIQAPRKPRSVQGVVELGDVTNKHDGVRESRRSDEVKKLRTSDDVLVDT